MLFYFIEKLALELGDSTIFSRLKHAYLKVSSLSYNRWATWFGDKKEFGFIWLSKTLAKIKTSSQDL